MHSNLTTHKLTRIFGKTRRSVSAGFCRIRTGRFATTLVPWISWPELTKRYANNILLSKMITRSQFSLKKKKNEKKPLAHPTQISKSKEASQLLYNKQ